MPVQGLNHVNLRTDDIAGTTRFYADLLDLKLGIPATSLPAGSSRWLCDVTGKAILHVRLGEIATAAAGAVDHVAIDCSGKQALLDRLAMLEIPFGRYDGLVPGMTQIFVTGPHGVKLELIFIGE